MSRSLDETQIVVIGGAIKRAAARDVLLVERNDLGSGTTSSSAGLLGQVRSTAVLTRLVQRTFRAIRDLEAEFGEPVGFREVGSLRIAATAERERELEAQFAIARDEGVAVELIDKAEAQRLVPGLDLRLAR